MVFSPPFVYLNLFFFYVLKFSMQKSFTSVIRSFPLEICYHDAILNRIFNFFSFPVYCQYIDNQFLYTNLYFSFYVYSSYLANYIKKNVLRAEILYLFSLLATGIECYIYSNYSMKYLTVEILAKDKSLGDNNKKKNNYLIQDQTGM